MASPATPGRVTSSRYSCSNKTICRKLGIWVFGSSLPSLASPKTVSKNVSSLSAGRIATVIVAGSSNGLPHPTQSFESPDVGGEQVVLDDAPVFGPVGVDDVVVVEVLQGTAMRGFAAPQVGGAFGRDHIARHAQRDHPVGRPAAAGDSAVGLLDGDLVAEEPRGPGAGVRDQRLFARQFQPEVVAQERRQLILDSFGFGLGSGEPEELIVGLCRPADYADRGVMVLVDGVDRGRVVGIIPAL